MELEHFLIDLIGYQQIANKLGVFYSGKNIKRFLMICMEFENVV